MTQAMGHSYASQGHNLMPVDDGSKSMVSPVLNYPYEHARSVIEKLKTESDPDACHGLGTR